MTKYTALPYQFRAAYRRARSVPLSRWVSSRRGGYAGPTATFVPSEMEMGITADVVAYEEREPRITPTGILDHRGQMLLRVTVPIKEEIGLIKSRFLEDREPDEVETILPEDLLAVSDCGLGVGYVTPEEVDDGSEDQAALIRQVIQQALEEAGGDAELATKLLAEKGLEVEFAKKEPGP